MKQRLSPKENRRAWLYAALIVLMMIAAGALFAMFVVRSPQANSVSLPPASQVLQQAAEDLDRIVIDAAFDPETRLLTGTQVLNLTNRTGQDQSAAVLRSYSGAYLTEETSPVATEEMFLSCYGDMFESGGLMLRSAKVDGELTLHHWMDSAQTVLKIPAAWKADETISITLSWDISIPDCASRFGFQSDIFALGNIFPLPAVWMDGAWRTEEYVPIGDPFVTECANWSVRLTLPSSYRAAGTGYAVPKVSGDTAVYEMDALATRDFALVISNKLVSAQRTHGDTLVTAWAQNASDTQEMLRCALQALESYEKRWGKYVYPSFTLAEVDFPFGGMEYPGFAMIASDAVRAGGENLAYAVAHETAHQWWAVQVGSDSWYEPWQDESLCEYALMDFIGDHYGAAARETAAYNRIETALRITIPRDVTPGSPIDYFADMDEYARVVYRRGAAMWMALENFMGKEKLDAALRDYHDRFRFSIASREDLTGILSGHAGLDLSALMTDYLDTEMN